MYLLIIFLLTYFLVLLIIIFVIGYNVKTLCLLPYHIFEKKIKFIFLDIYRLSIYYEYIDNLYMKGVEFMAIDKSLMAGSTTMLILKLLEDKDMYGYQMIEQLSKMSNNAFTLKAGTLYPLLHSLEQQGMVTSYDDNADSGRVRKYYSITKKGRRLLADKKAEWENYVSAVNQVLQGGALLEPAY